MDLSEEGILPMQVRSRNIRPRASTLSSSMERNGVACAKVAPSRLREGGLIIFDNSDKPKFKPGLDYLHSCGFGSIDFSGPVAQVGAFNCTSVFAQNWKRWLQNIPVVFQGW
jgi:hypothetical protein